MTSHELANKLLEMPDVVVYIPELERDRAYQNIKSVDLEEYDFMCGPHQQIVLCQDDYIKPIRTPWIVTLRIYRVKMILKRI